MINALISYTESLLFSGDFVGFITSIYTPMMGQFFGGVILLTIFLLTYIRTQDMMYGAILWILLAPSMEYMIPVQGFSIAKIFLVLGIASGLFSLFTRGRGRSPG